MTGVHMVVKYYGYLSSGIHISAGYESSHICTYELLLRNELREEEMTETR